MLCSIVMPVLNGESYIEDALQSVLSQTHLNWELIVVDGGSTDRTLDILTKFRGSDMRISVISQKGHGMYDAIITGLDVAKGEVLGWLNSDDKYLGTALERVCHHLLRNNEDRWVTGFQGVWDRAGTLNYVLPLSWWPKKLIQKGYFHPDFLGCIQAESTFFRRSLWAEMSSMDKDEIRSLRLAGDYLLWRKLAAVSHLVTIPTVLGGIRFHGKNRSTEGMTRYIDEVYETGTLRVNPKVGRRIRRLFHILSVVSGYLRVTKNEQVNIHNIT